MQIKWEKWKSSYSPNKHLSGKSSYSPNKHKTQYKARILINKQNETENYQISSRDKLKSTYADNTKKADLMDWTHPLAAYLRDTK